VSLRAKRSNLAFDEIKALEIAWSPPFLSMNQYDEFFRQQLMIFFKFPLEKRFGKKSSCLWAKEVK